MKIKLYKYKIEAEINDDVEKTLKYFKDMGFPIELDIEETVVPKAEAILLMQKCPDEVVMYMFDSKHNDMGYFGKTFFLNNTKLGILLACDKINDNVDYTWKSMTHEIMHALNLLIRIKGRFLYDQMDATFVNGKWLPYFKNDQPYAPDGNYARCWELMRPHLHLLLPPTADVVMTRKSSSDIQTTGNLIAKRNGVTFECKTLELADLNNMPNVSCIPKGTYKVVYTFSPKFMKYTYEILKVPKRSGIRIHSANYFHQINGCVALGSNLVDINVDGQLDTVNSRKTIEIFEKVMQKMPFTLRVE